MIQPMPQAQGAPMNIYTALRLAPGQPIPPAILAAALAGHYGPQVQVLAQEHKAGVPDGGAGMPMQPTAQGGMGGGMGGPAPTPMPVASPAAMPRRYEPTRVLPGGRDAAQVEKTPMPSAMAPLAVPGSHSTPLPHIPSGVMKQIRPPKAQTGYQPAKAHTWAFTPKHGPPVRLPKAAGIQAPTPPQQVDTSKLMGMRHHPAPGPGSLAPGSGREAKGSVNGTGAKKPKDGGQMPRKVDGYEEKSRIPKPGRFRPRKSS